MSRLRVAPVVEGQGEVESIRILLERVWYEVIGGEYIYVTPAIRESRGRLVKEEFLQKAVRAAARELEHSPVMDDPALVLILIDADEDCPKEWGQKLRDYAGKEYPVEDVACVLAKVEYETWFVASSESLTAFLDLSSGSPAAERPEEARHGKGWVTNRFRDGRYSETQDQPRMTHAMDLVACRTRSPSFDKFCRELERRVQRVSQSA